MSQFTREEIQDLEDAIYFTVEHVVRKQELRAHTEKEIERMNKFVERLLKLRRQLKCPVGQGRN